MALVGKRDLLWYAEPEHFNEVLTMDIPALDSESALEFMRNFFSVDDQPYPMEDFNQQFNEIEPAEVVHDWLTGIDYGTNEHCSEEAEFYVIDKECLITIRREYLSKYASERYIKRHQDLIHKTYPSANVEKFKVIEWLAANGNIDLALDENDFTDYVKRMGTQISWAVCTCLEKDVTDVDAFTLLCMFTDLKIYKHSQFESVFEDYIKKNGLFTFMGMWEAGKRHTDGEDVHNNLNDDYLVVTANRGYIETIENIQRYASKRLAFGKDVVEVARWLADRDYLDIY